MQATIHDIELRTFIKERNDEFELMLITTSIWNEPLFRQIRPHLAIEDKIGAEGKFRHSVHEALYQALAAIIGRIIDAGSPMPGQMPPFNLLRRELEAFAEKAIYIAGSQIPQAEQIYFDAYRQHWNQHSAQTAQAGWRYWLSIRQRQIICFNATRDPDLDVSKQLSDADRLIRVNGDDDELLSARQIVNMQKDEVVRIPTGFISLDKKLGGGLGKGEGSLFVGATGCGKSVVSVQLSVDMSSPATGCKGLLIATEMEREDYINRILSNNLNIPYDVIKDGMPRQLLADPETKIRYECHMDNLEKSWLLYRWTDHKGIGLFSKFDDLIKRGEDKFGGLDHVHLDWIGGALGKEVYGAGREPRHVWQEAADSCAMLASEHKIAVVAYAQAHPQLALNKRRVGAEMACECKSLHRQMTTAIGISAMQSGVSQNDDETVSEATTYKDIQYFFLSKSRKSEGGLIPFRRNFRFMRIDPI